MRRVLLVYLCLLFVPFPLEQVPFTEGWDDAVETAELRAGVWMARHVLMRRPLLTDGEGWGDLIGYHFADLILLVLALLLVGIWSAVSRGPNETKWDSRLRVYLRLALGGTMISYGCIKLIPVQFGRFGLQALAMPWGEMRQYWVLWTFMSYSPVYTIFTGGVEVLAGALLYFRRTVRLGGLLTLAAVSNVLMLDIGYGVSAKLFAAHLVVASLFLLHFDARALVDFFLRGRPASPDVSQERAAARLWPTAAASALLVVIMVTDLTRATRRYRAMDAAIASTNAVSGLYDVVEVRSGENSLPLIRSDSALWSGVAIQGSTALVRRMSDSRQFFWLRMDSVRRELHFTERDLDNERQGDSLTFAYDLPDSRSMVLRGMLNGRAVTISLRRFDKTRYRLARARLHWFDD